MIGLFYLESTNLFGDDVMPLLRRGLDVELRLCLADTTHRETEQHRKKKKSRLVHVKGRSRNTQHTRKQKMIPPLDDQKRNAHMNRRAGTRREKKRPQQRQERKKTPTIHISYAGRASCLVDSKCRSTNEDGLHNVANTTHTHRENSQQRRYQQSHWSKNL